MKEYILKDKILEYLSQDDREGKRNSPMEIADEFNIDINYIRCCLEDLKDKNFIGTELMGNSVQHATTQQINWITYRGRFFLNQSGGFSKAHKAETWKQRLTKAKTIANISNAVMIICIGIWGVMVQDKSNKLENAQQRIEKLKHENDSLRAIPSARSRIHQ